MSEPQGWVEEARGGVYRVVLGDGVRVEASVRGRLKLGTADVDKVVVGDRVRLSQEGESWVITKRDDRTSELARAGYRARFGKVIAANLDWLAVMVSAWDPPAREEWIDRMLVIGEHAGLKCMLLINKVDLEGGAERADELTDLYDTLGYPVFPLSVETGEGVPELAAALADVTIGLVGPSGVGKSSLLNLLQPELEARTGHVSVDGRGRHTTVSSRMVTLPNGGRVVDTPGFADAEPWGLTLPELDRLFPEMRERRDACRFRECSHDHEPGCAVLAVLGEELSDSRYLSYLKLRASLEERGTRDY